MGKRQHQKDKLYLTCTEWSTLYGGRRAREQAMAAQSGTPFRRLPFDHCSLSLQPFTHPYCTSDGVIYDLSNIVAFIKKYGIDPATGSQLTMKSLIKLNMHKNSGGQYHCPVLYKVFTENSHIVAIKSTGNVFSYEAIEQLNIKTKHFKDLLTDQPFTKKDIIVILDPNNLQKFNVSDFYYVKNELKVLEGEESESSDGNASTLRHINNETRATLEELAHTERNAAKVEEKKSDNANQLKADQFNAAHYSTGAVAAAFTSTAMDRTGNTLEPAILDETFIKYSKVKKKGYIRLETNLGNLNVELYCDQTPKTCDNFIGLCKRDYYNGTIFHRLIKNFMIQGGDPTATGSGGQSFFGEPFEDEIRPQYSHEGRGVLSMANSGPNSNKSQFFITFRSCKHLDKKHTIFGRLVGGLDTLDKMEQIKTNDKDKPLDEIKIIKTIVFVDPFQEIVDEIARERERIESEKQTQSVAIERHTKMIRTGVGSFIDLNLLKDDHDEHSATTSAPKRKKLTQSEGFGNFSNW